MEKEGAVCERDGEVITSTNLGQICKVAHIPDNQVFHLDTNKQKNQPVTTLMEVPPLSLSLLFRAVVYQTK